MKNLLLICLVASACVHVRLPTGFRDVYDEPRNRYVDLRQCEPEFPLGITPGVGLSREDREQLIRAVDWWNRQFDREIFTIAGENDPSVSVVDYKKGAYLCGRKIAVAYLHSITSSGCIVDAPIEIECGLDNYPIWVSYRVFRHELGHVLGLDDTSYSYSIMYRYSYSSSSVKIRSVDEITDSRRAALLRMYPELR